MERREFLKNAGIGVAATGTVALLATTEGCSASQWITIAENDLPTVLQIATSIISIVGAASGNADLGAVTAANKLASDAKVALATALSLINSYKSAGSKGALADIDAALLAAQANLGGILSTLHISNATLQATLAAAVGSALTVIVAIQSLVPVSPAPVPASVAAAKKSTPTSHTGVIKAGFNEAVVAAGGAQFAI